MTPDPLTVKLLKPNMTLTPDEHRQRIERDNFLIAQWLGTFHVELAGYERAFYSAGHTYQSTRVLGYPAIKSPNDLWVLMDLFTQYRFQTVIELGTWTGGTTLWYAMLMEMLSINGGRIYSIDNAALLKREHGDEPYKLPQHRRITYIDGDTTDHRLCNRIMRELRDDTHGGPLLLNLDSDHHAAHVAKELHLWAPMVPIGSWMLVEDTNGAPDGDDPIGPMTIASSIRGGPGAALLDYTERHPGEWRRDLSCERYGFTMHPGGWQQRVGEFIPR